MPRVSLNQSAPDFTLADYLGKEALPFIGLPDPAATA